MHGPPSFPRNFPITGFESIAGDADPIEEETLPYYEASRFPHVDIGTVYETKYQVIGKLGYGSTSTVWLGRDLCQHKYVAMKFFVHDTATNLVNNNELKVAHHMLSLGLRGRGAYHVRWPSDHFGVGNSTCIVFEPLALSLEDLQEWLGTFTQELLHSCLFHVMHGLEYLHSDADVIHTDIKASNIIMKVRDEHQLRAVERAELEQPCPRKLSHGRTIYCSRVPPHPRKARYGLPVLTDFGEACIGRQTFTTHVQPLLYRSPEILLEMDWDHKIDIWNLGVLAWNLLEDRHLFNPCDEAGVYSRERHLAEIVAVLGPPPMTFLLKSPIWEQFFKEENGLALLKGQQESVAPVHSALEQRETELQGEDQKLFLSFIRSMLQWDPQARASAEVLRTENLWMRKYTDKQFERASAYYVWA